MPPLLNDFIGLQQEMALVSLLGPVEALRQAQILAASNFNYTPAVVAAILRARHDSARAPNGLAANPCTVPQAPPSGGIR